MTSVSSTLDTYIPAEDSKEVKQKLHDLLFGLHPSNIDSAVFRLSLIHAGSVVIALQLEFVYPVDDNAFLSTGILLKYESAFDGYYTIVQIAEIENYTHLLSGCTITVDSVTPLADCADILPVRDCIKDTADELIEAYRSDAGEAASNEIVGKLVVSVAATGEYLYMHKNPANKHEVGSVDVVRYKVSSIK